VGGGGGKGGGGRAGGKVVGGGGAREDDVQRLYESVADRHGRVDVAFHNAGISPPEDDSILSTGLEAWRRVQEVNLTSVYLCCKAVLPQMRRQGRGSIINTASFVAVVGGGPPADCHTRGQGGGVCCA